MEPPVAENDASRPARPDRTSALQWILLGAIIVLATVLRLLWVGSFEPHFDELWHLEVSTGRGTAHSELPKGVLIEQAPDVTSLRGAPPLANIYTHMNGNTHPPLYWFVLRLWRDAFAGDSLARARSLNAIFAAGSIALLFWIVRRLSGSPIAGLWAAAILALSSAQIESAQEVRNYPLATLCWLGATALVVGAEARGQFTWPRAIALAAATLATLMCLYPAAAAVAATGLYALMRLRGLARRRAAGAILAGALLFAAAWTPQFLRQRQAFAMQAAVDRTAEQRAGGNHAVNTLRRAAETPLRMLFEPRESMRAVAVLSGVMFVLPWFLVRRHPAALLWTMSLAAIVGAVTMLDLIGGTRQLELARHVVLAGPPVVALLALLAAAPIRAARIVPPLVALACALALGQTYLRQHPQFSDIGAYLSDRASSAEPVVFYSDPDSKFWSEWLFVGAGHYSRTFPRPVVLLDAPIRPAVIEQLRRWPNVWVVSGMSDRAPEQIVPGTIITDVKQNPYLGSVARLRWATAAEQRAQESMR